MDRKVSCAQLWKPIHRPKRSDSETFSSVASDVLMAVEMGSWSVWCRDGVTEGGREMNLLEKMEVWIEKYLREKKGLKAPAPRGWE